MASVSLLTSRQVLHFCRFFLLVSFCFQRGHSNKSYKLSGSQNGQDFPLSYHSHDDVLECVYGKGEHL